MKLQKVISKIFHSSPKPKPKQVEAPPFYDSKNATIEEFRTYVHYLAKNNINRTFYEPDRFVTEAERKAQKQKEAELKPFREFVHNLAVNNINRTFYC
jgi:hypothetical protein